MRVARILTRMNLGGPARQVLASDPILAAGGAQLRLYVGTPHAGEGDLFDRARELGLSARRVPGLGRGTLLGGAVRARRFLKGELAAFAPDLVHTHTTAAGWAGRRAAAGTGAALVHTFHGHVLEGYFPGPISRALARMERRLAAATDRVVAVSHATADDLVRLAICPEEKIVVVPPGIDLQPFLAIQERHGALRRQLGVDVEDFLVGVVGRLAPVKRPEWALAVFEQLATRYPRLQLCFVGDGPFFTVLERRLAALPPGLASRVHLLGAVHDMPEVLADLDAVLSTSRSEGLPVALIEAAAAGLPVVATRVGGVPELVVEERTGFLGETVDELAYGLAQLLEGVEHGTAPGGALGQALGRALGRAMGARARLRAEARHGAEGLAGRLLELYETLIEEKRCVS